MASSTRATMFAVCFAVLAMAAVAMDPNMPNMPMSPSPGPSSPDNLGNLVSPSMMIGFLAFIVAFLGL